MADKYDSNGEYTGGYTGDFKRKSSDIEKRVQDDDDDHRERDHDRDREHPIEEDLVDEPHISGVSHKVNEYMSELLAEKQLIDQHKFHNAARLLDSEITKVQAMNRVPARDHKYVDIYRERPIKVSAKVLVPVREHPKFNFVGKLLGPKGNSMKRLQEETMCKMAVLGRGSMKDRAKEEELRVSCDPKFAHLSDDLHVEISALGPPAEAHARVAFALAEVRKYLVPDNNDNIRQEQMREMDIMGGGIGEEGQVISGPVYRSVRRGVSGGGHHGSIRGEYTRSAPAPLLPMRTATRTPVHHSHHHSIAPSHHIQASSQSISAVSRGVMPAKTKILSILDRARIAMEESYGGGAGGGGYGEDVVVAGGGYETVVGDVVGYETYTSSPSGGVLVRSSAGRGDYDGEVYETTDGYGGYGVGRGGDGGSYESSQRWKTSYKSSGGSSRHAESSTSRYRSSPYSRPSK